MGDDNQVAENHRTQDAVEVWMIYSLFGSKDEALSAARALVSQRLVACANIHAGVTSVYRWEDTLCEEPEILLLAKTTRRGATAAMAVIRSAHSYALPCIVAFPLAAGFAPFMAWVAEQTANP